MPDQPRHLAGMRRDDDVASFAARQAGPGRRQTRSSRRRRDEGIVAPIDERMDESRVCRRLAEAWPDRDDVARDIEHALHAPRVEPTVRSLVERLASCIPGAIAATTAWQLAGVATVTSPAPDRSAPIAARCAAPVLPREPATISTRP